MSTILTSVITAGIVAILSGIITYVIQERSLRRQFEIEKQKLEQQFKLEIKTDIALTKFLNHVKFKRRSFKFMSQKLGGFDDDELRRMLVRNGAVRSYGKNNEEWWELLEESKIEDEDN